jgi:hypothetical protein
MVYLGWNETFKDRVDQANKTITRTLDNLGGTLQKHQDKSVRRY